jgi:hypothetical protein
LALVGGVVSAEKCEFKKMARVFFKDEACKEFDWPLTKEVDKKYGPVSWATEACGYNPAMGKSLTSACSAEDVTFWAYDDKKCEGNGAVVWKAPFNKCVNKTILYNKGVAPYNETQSEAVKSKKPEEPVTCAFKEMQRVFYKDDACTEIDYDLTKKIDDYYYPISYATEHCGCSAATGKCHTSACSAHSVTFRAYDITD